MKEGLPQRAPTTSFLGHPLPAIFFMWSIHRAAGRPTLRLPDYGLYSNIFRPSSSSDRQFAWRHGRAGNVFNFTGRTTLVTSVLCWVSRYKFWILKKHHAPSKVAQRALERAIRSITRWANLTLWTSPTASVHVSATYFMIKNKTHYLNVLVFNNCGVSDSKIWQSLYVTTKNIFICFTEHRFL